MSTLKNLSLEEREGERVGRGLICKLSQNVVTGHNWTGGVAFAGEALSTEADRDRWDRADMDRDRGAGLQPPWPMGNLV